MINPGYTYKGHRYEPYEDVEPEECIKIFHDVVGPSGARPHMDWSPYSTPSEAEFNLWVDLGCPGRIGIGGLSAKDLETIKLGAQNGMYGKALVMRASDLASRELPGSNVYKLERLAAEMMDSYEHFDGEPTCPKWFAGMIVKRYKEIERAAR